MSQNPDVEGRFRWGFPVCVAGCVATAILPLTVSSSDLAVILCVFVAAPIITFCLLGIAYLRRRYQRLASLSTFAVFLIFTAVLFTHFLDIRDSMRWFVLGRHFKAEVMSQPPLAKGRFRHIEWEVWGFAGSDTTVYLVFDPSNALAIPSQAHASGKFAGLPCEVYQVRRLDDAWYAVQFYTDTGWDENSSSTSSGKKHAGFRSG